MFLAIHRLVRALARAMALLGGAVLAALIVMVCLSILGRSATSVLHSALAQDWLPGLARRLLDTGIGPIRGDYELVESGMAFAVFAFLVWCQATGGHARVDLLADRFPARAQRILAAMTEVVFAGVLILIALKLQEGMGAQMRRRTTTFLLQYPLWWSYLAALIPAWILAGVSVWLAGVRVAEAVLGRPLLPPEPEDLPEAPPSDPEGSAP